MRRRRRSRKVASSGGGDIVGFLIVAGFFMLSFILKSALTLVIYGAPAVLLAGLLIYVGTKSTPPALPNLANFDPKDQNERIEALVPLANQLSGQIRRLYFEGQNDGIEFRNWRDGDGPRFREHSKKGKVLNRGLDEFEGNLNSCLKEIRSIKHQVSANIPDWRRPFDEWRHAATLKKAFVFGVIIYLITIVAAIPFTGELSRSAESVVFLNLLPTALYAPSVAASFVSALAVIVVRMSAFGNLENLVDHAFVEKWEALNAKWDPNADVIDECGDGFDDTDASGTDDDQAWNEDGEVDETENLARPWYVVLGIDEKASIAEIKTAWREGMKQYHPDRVAGLGPKLQALAEEETKELNGAYQIGLKLRG